MSRVVTDVNLSSGEVTYGEGGGGGGATVNVGDTTTLPAGSDATVVNSGTETDVVLDFGIPRGADGADGQDGADGAKGDPGSQGPKGDTGAGVPTGGSSGQALVKSSSTDYDTEWANIPTAGQVVHYATSTSQSYSTTKYASVSGSFTLSNGALVAVKFENDSTATSFTLNVGNTGNKDVYVGTAVVGTQNPLCWFSGATLLFVYDGTKWIYVEDPGSYSATWSMQSEINSMVKSPYPSTRMVVCNGTRVTILASYENTYVGTLRFNLADQVAVYLNNAATSSSNPLLWDRNAMIDVVRSGDHWNVVSVTDFQDYVVEPSTEGTAGQALVTDGQGGRSWASIAMIGIPTFSLSSWNESSDISTLPETPCFVLSLSDYSLWYCTSSAISRVTPELPLSIANGGTGASTAAGAPFVQKSGDTMTGDLYAPCIRAKSGNYQTADLLSTSEGGRVRFYAPDGSENVIDAYNNTIGRIRNFYQGIYHSVYWQRARDYNLDDIYDRSLPLSGGTLTGRLGINSYGITSYFGPANDGAVHFENDKGKDYYFDHTIQVDGELIFYNTGVTALRTANNASRLSYMSWADSYMYVVTWNHGDYNVSWWSSDIRLKENIEDSEVDALTLVNQIRHRSFDMKQNGEHHDIGYIAQELEGLDESFVIKVPQTRQVDNRTYFTGDYRYQIDERKVIPYLSRSIQQLSDENEELKKKNAELEARLEAIERKLGL